MKLLIYDNEWVDYLRVLPFDKTFVFSEDEVYEKTYNQKYDFYIFDFEYGYKALSNLRDSGDDTLAIFLSNIETIEAYKKSLKIADDFLKKRCLLVEELRLKIDYFIRKIYNLEDIIRYKDIYFNLKLRQIYKNNKKIDLTNLEYDLLILFFKNKNRFLSKEEIIEYLHITEGSLKVKISNLRKLGFNIENKKEIGYRLEEI